jgi:hypothetical protein
MQQSTIIKQRASVPREPPYREVVGHFRGRLVASVNNNLWKSEKGRNVDAWSQLRAKQTTLLKVRQRTQLDIPELPKSVTRPPCGIKR